MIIRNRRFPDLDVRASLNISASHLFWIMHNLDTRFIILKTKFLAPSVTFFKLKVSGNLNGYTEEFSVLDSTGRHSQTRVKNNKGERFLKNQQNLIRYETKFRSYV